LSRAAPLHPGGTPFVAGHPAPAEVVVEHPAAIVVRDPTPLCLRLVRDPVPTPVVGVGPPAYRVGPPVARPGGNLTGINLFNSELNSKRLELLRMLIPTAARVAVLVNPTDRANAETVMRDLDLAARTIGLQLQMFEASTSSEIDAAFASIALAQPDALFVAGQTYFNSRRIQLT
jgi:putative ABC transport system substrate-binding protein